MTVKGKSSDGYPQFACEFTKKRRPPDPQEKKYCYCYGLFRIKRHDITLTRIDVVWMTAYIFSTACATLKETPSKPAWF